METSPIELLLLVFTLILPNQNKVDLRRVNKASSIQYMAIEKVKLVHEYFPKHLHMGTAKIKVDKLTEEGKQ